MEKFYEKKNLGVPVTILVILAYFIGYSLTRSMSGTLLVAVLFAGVVFSLQFDDRVKNAVKHSYIFAALVQLVYMLFNVFETFISIFTSGRVDGYYVFGFIPRALTFLYTYGLILVNIAVVAVFALFIIMALLKKDLNIGLVSSILGDAPSKPKKQKPTYNQHQVPPVAPYNQAPVAPPQAPVNPQAPVAPKAPVAPPQAPVNPQAPVAPKAPVAPPQAPAMKADGGCHNCGHVNVSDAAFCASCGSKLK